MPGVTVEASSDVLIEKVKSAVTDGDGAYRIADLRPGTYSVTFTLPGFKTFRRDGFELPSEFTATLNAELGVGALEETITVTGASPVVDVTSTAKTSVLNREAIDLIPTGRSIQGMAQLVVGVSLNLPDTGGARAMQQTYMSTHGMTTSNTTVLVDGQMTNGLQTDGAIQSYYNDAMNAEMSYQTAAIGAETSSGGVRLNMIPREGGNQFHGDFKMAQRPGSWQSSNLTDRHQARGLTAGNAIDRIIDYTASLGGPIKKDKLWFFTSARYFSVNNFIANTYHGRRQPGHRRPVHQERHGPPDVAGVAAQQDLGLLRRDRQVPRPRHAVQLRSRDRGHRVELARVSHDRDQVDLAGDQLAVPRGGFLEQHRVLHQRISRGHREAGVHAGVVSHGARRTSSTSAATRRPARPTRPRARWRSTGTRRPPT